MTKPSSFSKSLRKSTVQGRGKLLLQESREDIAERAAAFVRGGALLVVTGAVISVISVMLLNANLPFFAMLMIFMFIALGPMLALIGASLLLVSRRLKPVRIFENGIEATAPVGTRTFFFSYGELRDITETRNAVDGEVYIFRTSNPYKSISIRKRMRGFAQLLPDIQSKLGKEEYVIKVEPTPQEAASSRKMEYGLYAAATILGIVASWVFIFFSFEGQPFPVMLIGYGMVMPMLTMFAVTFMTYRMTRMQKVVPRRLNFKIPAAIVAGTLAFFFITVGIGISESAPAAPPTSRYIEPKPLTSSLAPGLYANSVLTVNGSVLVDSGQILRIVNSSLIMNLASDREFGIWIADGGTLLVDNSTITSQIYQYTYTFEIFGSARIENSTVSGLWSNLTQPNYDGGLEIYSSDVVIEWTEFPDARLNAILIMDSSPTIAHSTIADAGDDGIEMHNSKAHIIGNTIERCDYAMIVSQGSDALIEGNVISRNGHGIAVELSSPIIRSNTFVHNSNYAISYDSESRLTLQDNVFVDNERKVVEASGLYIVVTCGAVTALAAVLCLAFLFWMYRNQMRRDKDHSDPHELLRKS